MYDVVDVEETWQVTGKAPTSGRWVDVNKGNDKNPLVRSETLSPKEKSAALISSAEEEWAPRHRCRRPERPTAGGTRS